MALTTICVVGFPQDVSRRELTNLCRYLPGYEDSNINKGRTLFVKFKASFDADAAIQALHGTLFDQHYSEEPLKAEYAKRELEPRTAIPVDLSPEADPSVITTLAVLGSKSRGFRQRELEAWLRKLPGFVDLQVNDRIDGTFVKFVNRSAAETALQEAIASELGAEWARRNLSEEPRPPSAQASDTSSRKRSIDHHDSSSKRARVQEYEGSGNNELSTVAVLGLKSKGLHQDEVAKWFADCSGYVTHQSSRSADAIFVKFANSTLADQALQDANASQIAAEWARRNLTEDDPHTTAAVAPPAVSFSRSRESAHYSSRDSGRQRGSSGSKSIDTITCFGPKNKKIRKRERHEFFEQCRGFVTLQVNDRLDATFVKFDSSSSASRAMKDAEDAGILTEWARRNLTLDQ